MNVLKAIFSRPLPSESLKKDNKSRDIRIYLTAKGYTVSKVKEKCSDANEAGYFVTQIFYGLKGKISVEAIWHYICFLRKS